MKTRAVRLYGESDLRLEEFDMGELKDDEILMELITDSVCMSTYKESIQGAKHQRVNDDISEHPIIVGHEFAGIIREVGAKWKDKYQVGTKYTMRQRSISKVLWQPSDILMNTAEEQQPLSKFRQL